MGEVVKSRSKGAEENRPAEQFNLARLLPERNMTHILSQGPALATSRHASAQCVL